MKNNKANIFLIILYFLTMISAFESVYSNEISGEIKIYKLKINEEKGIFFFEIDFKDGKKFLITEEKYEKLMDNNLVTFLSIPFEFIEESKSTELKDLASKKTVIEIKNNDNIIFDFCDGKIGASVCHEKFVEGAQNAGLAALGCGVALAIPNPLIGGLGGLACGVVAGGMVIGNYFDCIEKSNLNDEIENNETKEAPLQEQEQIEDYGPELSSYDSSGTAYCGESSYSSFADYTPSYTPSYDYCGDGGVGSI